MDRSVCGPASMITLDLTKDAVRPQKALGVLLSAVSFQPREYHVEHHRNAVAA